MVPDVFRLRAGVNRLPWPFLNDDSSRFALSGGAGVRLRSFYFDLSYRRVSQDERYYPYVSDAAPVQEVLQESRLGTLGMTLGFKFYRLETIPCRTRNTTTTFSRLYSLAFSTRR